MDLKSMKLVGVEQAEKASSRMEEVEIESEASTDFLSDKSNPESAESTMMPFSVSAPRSEGVRLICAGLPRTGMKTLRTALSELGYDNFYDQEDIVATYDLWDGVLWNKEDCDAFPAIFQQAQVVMGMPTFCFWEQILERYPNARVILTVRDEDQWWESVRRAKSAMDDTLPGAPLKYGSAMRRIERLLVPSYHRFCEILRFAWATTLGANALHGDELNEAATRNCYRRHNSYIKATLGKKMIAGGQKQLLVYDVREGWAPLCKFLDVDAPAKDFPSVLNVPYFVGNTTKSTLKEDYDQELEHLLVPDSEFGTKMRQELRRGLVVGGAGLTLLLGTVLAASATQVIEVPVVVMALAYLALLAAAWQAYVIMHGLVMRVPALMVLPMAMKSLLIAGCLQACFITYGILKEMIVTKDHIASPVLILSARLMSVVCGAVALLMTEGRISFGGASLYSFGAFGFTNEASTWAGYEMLKYVSFPVQVMAKSCKLLPNMIMGKILNGTKYEWSQYAQAIGAMVCVTVMHLTDEKDHKKGGVKGTAGEDEMSDALKSLIGVGLLVFFFATDSFTSQWQTALYKKYPDISQTQMMLAGNLVGVVITMGSIVTRWTAVSKSLNYALANPGVMSRILMLGLSGAMGQFCIYTAIKVLGPLAFTWIMTSRQLFSVLISLVMFGHGVSPLKLMCILTVFAIMSSKQLSRVGPQMAKKCKACRSRTDLKETSTSVEEIKTKKPSRALMARGSQLWGALIDPGTKKLA